eukprot:2923783-Rhodomonas_salina.5
MYIAGTCVAHHDSGHAHRRIAKTRVAHRGADRRAAQTPFRAVRPRMSYSLVNHTRQSFRLSFLSTSRQRAFPGSGSGLGTLFSAPRGAQLSGGETAWLFIMRGMRTTRLGKI